MHLVQSLRITLLSAVIAATSAFAAFAAPYAAMVIDARSGEILYQENADTRLYPASLTKMMTLYICFEAISRGELSLDTPIKISSNAANEAPSKLGLRAGQTIALRYLIRAAAVKSANDAATAIGEAISGSEEGFAKRMNDTARALGMNNTTFVNANGLTRKGHLSTAHDMTILGRQLFYDYPQYYNIFSRRSTDAGLAEVSNTNRRFLDSYKGADGIKTGYTGPAGFNLVASAERGGVRIIATVFGGTSTAQRNAKMTDLLDLGFAKAPANVTVRKPASPAYTRTPDAPAALADARVSDAVQGGAGKTLRVSGVINTSPHPKPRPGAAAPELLVAMQDNISSVLATVAEAPPAPPPFQVVDENGTVLSAPSIGPMPRPQSAATQIAAAAPVATAMVAADPMAPADAPLATAPVVVVAATDVPFQTVQADIPADLPFELVSAAPSNSIPAVAAVAPSPGTLPKRRPEMVMLASVTPTDAVVEAAPEVVTRLSTSDGRVWGITLGQFNSPYEAERVLMKTALAESGSLSDALRKVVKRKTGFEANYAGMTQDQADLACRRLQAREISCFTVGP